MKPIVAGTLALFSFSAINPALAHVRQRAFVHEDLNATEGQESIVHWDFGSQVKVLMHQFTGSLDNSSTIDFATARTLMGAAISQWSDGFEGLAPLLKLDLSGGLPYATSNACETGASEETDGRNNLIFTSKADENCMNAIPTNSGILGLTRTRYAEASGLLVEQDIQFDDVSFLFKTSGANDLTTNPKTINLKDVMVHEFGHFLALDHSGVRDATMVFALADGLETTASDDHMGMLSLYPTSASDSALASLKGSLLDGNEAPVFGAFVFLLDARTLKVAASEITNVNGGFEFCAIPSGPKVVYAYRVKPFGSNIHEYYCVDGTGSSVTKTVDGVSKCYNPDCTLMNDDLDYSFLTKEPSGTGAAGGLAMKVVNLRAGKSYDYLNLVGSSVAPTADDVSSDSGGSFLQLDEPRLALLRDVDLGLSESATVVGTDRYTVTVPSSQNLSVRTAALALFGRLNLTLKLFAASDLATDIASSCSDRQVSADVTNGLDPHLNCSGLAAGDYVIEVTGSTSSCSKIPGNPSNCVSGGIGESTSTSHPFYVITAYDTDQASEPIENSDSVLDSKSQDSGKWANLPSCGEKSLLVSLASGGKGGGCCGTLSDRLPGGPKGPPTFWLSLLLSPLSWFALYWILNQSRKGFRHARV